MMRHIIMGHVSAYSLIEDRNSLKERVEKVISGNVTEVPSSELSPNTTSGSKITYADVVRRGPKATVGVLESK